MSPRSIGLTVKRLRKAKGLSQGQLAHKVNVSRPYITMLEGGARTTPSLDTCRRLAKALGVSISTLLEEGQR